MLYLNIPVSFLMKVSKASIWCSHKQLGFGYAFFASFVNIIIFYCWLCSVYMCLYNHWACSVLCMYVCVYMYVHMYACVCMYVCTYVCMHLCM